MSNLHQKIIEIEAKAAESQLTADLATCEEARTYNRRLAEELREFASRLREKLNAPSQASGLQDAG